MQCVYFDNQRPDSFEEQFEFSSHAPYSIQVKRFDAEDIVPLHYANTLEILLCDGLSGLITIDAQQFSLGGKQLFVIPPRTVHSTSIPQCPGRQYVLKVSFEEMSRYLDIPGYLALCGCEISQLSYQCPEYGQVENIISRLMEHDGDLPRCLIMILELFHLLSKHADPGREPSAKFKSSSLQELVNWTQQNYMRKITIGEAAAFSGYSKYHFCSRFKDITGMTYVSYLNSVRIAHACTLLRRGEPVQKVCRDVGFDNLSYFIQLFRQMQRVTPRQYARQHRSQLPTD